MSVLKCGACLFLAATIWSACAGDRPGTLGASEEGAAGPTIVYEPLDRPEPEIPFPNNAVTRLVDHTVTGRLLNLYETSPMELERRLKKQLNKLDGFSIIGPITVSFDADLDLSSVHEASVLLIDVSPDSPDFGHAIPLDLKAEHFPVDLKPRGMFPYDPLGHMPDMVFPEDNEVNGERVTHYDTHNKTLIFRPMFPLRPATTYAVVLTRAVVGLEGGSVQSPFVGPHFANQRTDLSHLESFVDGGWSEIAFSWSFTTQSVTTDMEWIRDGLDGTGPLAELKDLYPGRIANITDLTVSGDGDGTFEEEGIAFDERDNRFIVQADFFALIFNLVGDVGFGVNGLTYENTDYFVFGELEVPDFRSDDHTIWVDRILESVPHKPSTATFAISIPKTTAQHKPPFPVIIYSHGARTARLEMLVIADLFSKHGYAMMGIDAVGHGPFAGDLKMLIERTIGQVPDALLVGLLSGIGQYVVGKGFDAKGLSLDEAFESMEQSGLWRAIFVDGRAEDLDGDGILLSGDGYFVPNAFELSSNGRQTVLDTLMVYRFLNRLDPSAVPGEPLEDPQNATVEELNPYLFAGDFNADGVLDLGGPGNRYFAAGTSLGGIHTSVIMALEPGLKTGAPIVSGGGMTDILVRTTLADAVDAILAEVLGLAVVGCPVIVEEGVPATEISLSWNNTAVKCQDENTIAYGEFARVPAIPGGSVELYNSRLHEEGGEKYLPDAWHTASIAQDGGFSVTVATDEGDPLQFTMKDVDGNIVEVHHFTAPRPGLGRMRNTGRFRRIIQTAQTAIDRSDPLAYARHLIREPLAGMEERNVLHLVAIGDRTVPFATSVAWDRAVGLFGLDEQASLDISESFVDHDTLNGEPPYWDVDDLFDQGDGIGPFDLIETEQGVSAVRFAATNKHEYVAIPDEGSDFDWATYSRNQIIRFFNTDGAVIDDDLCLEDSSCSWIDP